MKYYATQDLFLEGVFRCSTFRRVGRRGKKPSATWKATTAEGGQGRVMGEAFDSATAHVVLRNKGTSTIKASEESMHDLITENRSVNKERLVEP